MHISVAVAQFPVSLDIEQNMMWIRRVIDEAHCDELVVLPEGALSGYCENIAPAGLVLQEVVSEQCTILRTTIDLSAVSQWYLDQCRSDVVALQY